MNPAANSDAAEGRPKPWRKRLLWVLLVGLVLALAAARPVYRGLKIRRAHGFAAEAEKHLQQQQWKEAFRKAQAAYQLTPQDAPTLRVVARLYTLMRQEQALIFWDQLLALPDATDGDRRDCVRLALVLRKFEAGEPPLQRLLRLAPGHLPNLQLAAEFYFAKGDKAGALHFCRLAWDREPAHPHAKLSLARVLLMSPTPTEEAEARRHLWALSEAKDQAALDALALLARLASLSQSEQERLLARLSQHPLAKTEHEILGLELKLRSQPAQRPVILETALGKARRRSLDHKLEIGRWFNRQREFTRTLELISLPVSLQRQDLFLVRLDALAALGRWAEVRQNLDERQIPIDALLAELYRARVAKELGETEKAALHWRRVHIEMARQPQAILYVAQYAERIGEKSEAVKAYRRLTQQTALRRQAYEALIRLAEKEGDTFGLREIMKELVALYPDDPAPKNDLAYLNLLLREHLEASKAAAQKLLEQKPDFLSYRTTAALACLRLDDFRAARALYEGLSLEWSTVLPGWQAVHVAVCGAGGETHLARVLARQIPLDRLKPEERLLVQPYL
ncbi:MAG: hypothetical protein HY674_12505 [Chloroflexi bacterium]|nr:hypothetical protein [Chloroflexota bacterium]